jgi:outer membrane protein assembly factor BamD
MKKFFKLFISNLFAVIILLPLFVASCSKKDISDDEAYTNMDAKTLYSQGNDALQKSEYKKAAEIFSKVTYEFPYDALASKAHVMVIYANYLLEDYDSAIFSAENYVKTHPISKYTPYVYYIKALSYYAQIELPQRDQTMTGEAKLAFTELISRFPTSEYTKDSKAKLALIDDHLAAHEMVIGRYYLNKEEMPAAIQRFKKVVSDYSTTSQVEEALSRLVEAYLFLGLKDEAKKNAAVLGHNYPSSQWYKYSYNLLQSNEKKK